MVQTETIKHSKHTTSKFNEQEFPQFSPSCPNMQQLGLTKEVTTLVFFFEAATCVTLFLTINNKTHESLQGQVSYTHQLTSR